MTKLGQNIELYTGDDLDLRVTVTDENDAALDITSATATYTVKDAPGGASLFTPKTVGSGIALTTPASGILTISIASANTRYARGDRDYFHELEIVLANGKTYTAFNGRFRLRRSIAGTGA